MRTSIIIAAAAGSVLLGATPGFADTQSPWCLKAVSDDVVVDLCEYRTFEQCAQERFNYGSTSFCFRNVGVDGNATSEKLSRKAKRKTD